MLGTLDAETHELQQKPGVSVTWHVAPRLPSLYTDPLKLKVVLKNLVANAVKFTDHGDVGIRAAANYEFVVKGFGTPRETQLGAEIVFLRVPGIPLVDSQKMLKVYQRAGQKCIR